jgi:hypothetical protein
LHAPIAAAATAAHIDPSLLEGMVFLESAGRSDAIAGGDPAAAAGVTQILAGTGRDLLGMHIDLSASHRLTKQILDAQRGHRTALATQLERQRRAVDERFDPKKALGATGRYLALARAKFGRSDFAVASYHMGIGNLANVIRAYAGPQERRLAIKVVQERKLTYAQLYFDSTPFHNKGAYGLLGTLGDNSDTYYWRVLAARDIMSLYRHHPRELSRLNQLQNAYRSGEAILHPPGSTEVFGGPAALSRARSRGVLLAVPNKPGEHHFAVDPAVAAQARQFSRAPGLYSALRPEALAALYYVADRVHAVSAEKAPLMVATTARDSSYQAALVRRGLAGPPGYSLYTTGYSFDIDRRYATPKQAQAFQAVLNRLQALDVIAWGRKPDVIQITVSNEAKRLIPLLHGASLGDGS